HLVLRRQFTHMRERLGFAQCPSEIERRFLPDRARQRLTHQLVEAARADTLEHRNDVAGRWPDMASHEIGSGLVGGLERRVHKFFPVMSLSSPRQAGIKYAGQSVIGG